VCAGKTCLPFRPVSKGHTFLDNESARLAVKKSLILSIVLAVMWSAGAQGQKAMSNFESDPKVQQVAEA
jgi:hypothetical protein